MMMRLKSKWIGFAVFMMLLVATIGGYAADITQIHSWQDGEVLTHTDLNAEFAQLIATINDLSNANIATDAAIAGSKISIGTNTTWLQEHNASGAHTALAASPLDDIRIKRNTGTPASKVDIDGAQIIGYTSDTVSTRTGKLFQDIDLTADITVAGANGLDTGTEANSTRYYIWFIGKANATEAALLSTSAVISTLTLPTDYVYAKLVGTVNNDSDGNFDIPQPMTGVGWAGSKIQPLPVQMVSGTYVGTAPTTTTVSGLDFDPDVIFILPHSEANAPWVKVDTMSGGTCRNTYLTYDAAGTYAAITLTQDGFTASGPQINTASTTYSYIALKMSWGLATQ